VTAFYNQYDASSGGTGESLPTSPGSFALSNLSTGVHYDVMLKTTWFINDVGHTMDVHLDLTLPGQYTAPLQAPNAPRAVSAAYITGVGNAPGHVQVSWVNSPDNESGFRIYRAGSDGVFVLVKTEKQPDVTSWDDTTINDLGPWTYEVRAYNNAGQSVPTQSSQVTPIGGPDITAHLTAIAAEFDRQWNNLSFLSKLALSENFIGALNPNMAANNFDITPLANHNLHTAPNDGVLPDGGGDQSITVTVAGKVYRQVEVDYYLYGLIFSKIYSFSVDFIVGPMNIFLYRTLEFLRSGNDLNLIGREAWFFAGFDRDFDEASPAAINDVDPAPAPNGSTVPDTGPLPWHAGNSNQLGGSN
jgi:hypothetical protein